MINQHAWFKEWFDTSYYHKLYEHRNEKEAESFITLLSDHLKLRKGARVLDLPCGRGRHAVFLEQLGYRVIGADLSVNSIEYAKKLENESLRFIVHDMRKPLDNTYDAIFNLFTSFGYFDDDSMHIEVLKNFKKALKPGGILVIDFLNIFRINEELVSSEVVVKGNITFHISRENRDGFLVKNIDFTDRNKHYHFEEKVRSFSLNNFESMAAEAGLEIVKIFGDYRLGTFDKNTSDRLILLFSWPVSSEKYLD